MQGNNTPNQQNQHGSHPPRRQSYHANGGAHFQNQRRSQNNHIQPQFRPNMGYAIPDGYYSPQGLYPQVQYGTYPVQYPYQQYGTAMPPLMDQQFTPILPDSQLRPENIASPRTPTSPLHTRTASQRTPISIKRPTGETISFTPASVKSSNSNTSTPISTPASLKSNLLASPLKKETKIAPTTPSTTNSKPLAKPAAKNSTVAEFMKKVAKAAEESKKKLEAKAGSNPKVEAKEEAINEKKVKEEAELKAKEESEKKAKEEADQKAKIEAEQKAKEEAELKAKEEAELKATEEAEQKVKEEAELKAKQEAEQKAKELEELKKEEERKRIQQQASEIENSINSQLEAATNAANAPPVEEDVENKNKMSMTQFINRIKSVKPITDIYTFKYPGLTQPPSDRFKGSSKPKYDPLFLMEFQAITYPIDDEFATKISKLIISKPQEPRAQSSYNKNFSKGGGVGQFNMSGARQFSNRGKRNVESRNPSRKNNRDGQMRSNTRRENTRRNEPEKDEKPEPPKEPVVPLPQSKNRWIPKSRAQPVESQKAPDGSDIMDAETVQRTVKSLLNKMTLEKFDKISGQIIDIAKQSRFENDGRTLRQVLEQTFAKACDEPHWSSMYAQFCAAMFNSVSEEISDDDIKDKNGQPITGGLLFRKYLLNRCQEEYESDRVSAENSTGVKDLESTAPDQLTDEYYIAVAAKRRQLGLVRFIGELYILGLLTEKVILACTGDLINSVNREEDTTLTFETLCQLLTTVGPRLQGSQRSGARLDQIFLQLKTIIDTFGLSARIKFMIMDLIDLKNANWVGKQTEQQVKTIAEIEAEARQNEHEDNRRKDSSRQNSNRNPNRNTGFNGAFKTVRNTESSLFGPKNNFGSRMKNSGLSSRSASINSNRENSKVSEPSKTTSQLNMFAALQHDDDDAEKSKPEEDL